MSSYSFRAWVRKLSVQTQAAVMATESHQLSYKISLSMTNSQHIFKILIFEFDILNILVLSRLLHLRGHVRCREVTVTLGGDVCSTHMAAPASPRGIQLGQIPGAGEPSRVTHHEQEEQSNSMNRDKLGIKDECE